MGFRLLNLFHRNKLGDQDANVVQPVPPNPADQTNADYEVDPMNEKIPAHPSQVVDDQGPAIEVKLPVDPTRRD